MKNNIISTDIQQALSSMGIARRYTKFGYARLYINIGKLDAAFSALDPSEKSSNSPACLPLNHLWIDLETSELCTRNVHDIDALAEIISVIEDVTRPAIAAAKAAEAKAAAKAAAKEKLAQVPVVIVPERIVNRLLKLNFGRELHRGKSHQFFINFDAPIWYHFDADTLAALPATADRWAKDTVWVDLVTMQLKSKKYPDEVADMLACLSDITGVKLPDPNSAPKQLPMENRSYGAWLRNSDCMFDSELEFPTAEAVVEWALGRGGSYGAEFCDDSTDEDRFVTATISNDDIYVTDNNNAISYYTPERFAAYLRRHL